MKTRTTFTLFLTAILTLAAGSAFGAYSGGSGTAGAPYKIATKTDLLALAAATADYGKCFILTADIDMIGQVFTAPIIAADGSPAFSGTFDGNGHKITNFTISEDYYDIGLFGSIIGGSVKNLGIENCSVVGYYYVGCLVGYNSGSISNCYSTGSVSGPSDSSNIGCLVGYNSGGTVSDCYSTGTAGGSSNVGCLVGWSSGTVSRCYATGSVTGDIIGGLVGEPPRTASMARSMDRKARGPVREAHQRDCGWAGGRVRGHSRWRPEGMHGQDHGPQREDERFRAGRNLRPYRLTLSPRRIPSKDHPAPRG